MPRIGKRGPRGYQARSANKAAKERAAREGRPVTTKELQRDGMVRHGGARPRSGRPKGIPWDTIQRTVERTGADLEEVLSLPSIPANCLEDPANIERLRELVERGQRVFRLSIREALADKGVKGQSVTALLGLARNTAGLDFDQQTAQLSSAPDVVGLEAKIDELISKLAKKAAPLPRAAEVSGASGVEEELARLRAENEALKRSRADA